MTCFTEKLLKTTLKNIKASGNGPNNKQQMKEHLFKKIYKNLVRKVNKEHSLLLLSQLSETETSCQTAAANKTGIFLLPVPSWRAFFPGETGPQHFFLF